MRAGWELSDRKLTSFLNLKKAMRAEWQLSDRNLTGFLKLNGV